MADITTKTVENLIADETLSDTDTFIYGDSGGNTLKKAPLSTLKKSIASDLIEIVEVSKTDISLAASTNAVTDITVSKSGYTFLAAVGFKCVNSSSSGVNSSMANIYSVYKYADTTARVLWRNTSTSAAKVDITVYALMMKTL